MSMTLLSNTACTDTTLPFAERDQLLYGVVDGSVRLFDLAKSYSFPAQAAPVDGSLIRDLARNGSTSIVDIPSGETLAFSGGGIDFTGNDAVPTGVIVPGGIADIVPAQEFLGCMYVKLPLAADWPTAASVFQVIAGGSVADQGAPSAGKHLFTINMVTQDTSPTRPRIWLRRQTSVGQNFDALYFSNTEIPLGELCQIAVWRKAGVFYGRIKGASVSVVKSVSAAANNTADLTGHSVIMGRTSISAAAHPSKHKLYRGFIENLASSGRDPVTVLDADWARTVARGVFS